MTNNEASKLKRGDWVKVNTLVAEVEGITIEWGDVFVRTSYGNFNASVCAKVEGKS